MMIYITGAADGCNEFFLSATVGDRRLIDWIRDLAQSERCTGGLLPEPQQWNFVITDSNTVELESQVRILGGVVIDQLSPEFAKVVFRAVLPISYNAYHRYALNYSAFARIEPLGEYKLVLFRDEESAPEPLTERLVKGPSYVQDLFIEDDDVSVIGSERARLIALQGFPEDPR